MKDRPTFLGLTFYGWYILILITIICIIAAASVSCTDHTRARIWGGEETVSLPSGYRLMEVTWKDQSSLWYLIEPMDSGYTPKIKVFQEDSRFGLLEGKIIFIENK